MEPNPLEIIVGDGKYTIVQTLCGSVSVRRNREPWRDRTGDELVLCLAQELDAASAEIRLLKRDRDALERIIDKLESESGGQLREIDRLQDDLTRARERDL